MKEAEKTIKNVYIALGSNIDPEINIQKALNLLSKEFGKILISSSIWKTKAVGSDDSDFLNTVILVKSDLSADALKSERLRPLEAKMGRVRTSNKNAPRTIDLDILIYGNLLLELELWERVHLAVPLAEIYPEFRHPSTNLTISEIAKELLKKTKITQFENN